MTQPLPSEGAHVTAKGSSTRGPVEFPLFGGETLQL